MLKNVLTIGMMMFIAVGTMAQTVEKNDSVKNAKKTKEYQFTDVKLLKTTPVKNQSSSGTCWSFAGTAFLESQKLICLKCLLSVMRILKRLKSMFVCMAPSISVAEVLL